MQVPRIIDHKWTIGRISELVGTSNEHLIVALMVRPKFNRNNSLKGMKGQHG